jgi:hypothetical protein
MSLKAGATLSVYESDDMVVKYQAHQRKPARYVRHLTHEHLCIPESKREEELVEEELVDVVECPIEDKKSRDFVISSLSCRQVKVPTDFSLFLYVHARSVNTHSLVQELVGGNVDSDEKADSFVVALRLISSAFSKRTSPKHLLVLLLLSNSKVTQGCHCLKNVCSQICLLLLMKVKSEFVIGLGPKSLTAILLSKHDVSATLLHLPEC